MRIAVLNDIHASPTQRTERLATDQVLSELPATLAQINHHHPELVMVLGDLFQSAWELQHDREQFLAVFQLLTQLHSPFIFCPGNHEHRTLQDAGMLEVLQQLGYHQPLFGEDSSFEYHILWLNVTEVYDHDHRQQFIPGEQVAWLKATLPRLQKPTLLFLHHSVAAQATPYNYYSIHGSPFANADNSSELQELLASTPQITMVVNAHVHWLGYHTRHSIPMLTVPAHTENIAAPEVQGNVPRVFTLIDLPEKASFAPDISAATPPTAVINCFADQYAFASLEIPLRT